MDTHQTVSPLLRLDDSYQVDYHWQKAFSLQLLKTKLKVHQIHNKPPLHKATPNKNIYYILQTTFSSHETRPTSIAVSRLSCQPSWHLFSNRSARAVFLPPELSRLNSKVRLFQTITLWFLSCLMVKISAFCFGLFALWSSRREEDRWSMKKIARRWL